MTDEFRGRLAQVDTKEERVEMLDDLLPEAFAVVREAAKRTLGQRHFDVQIMGGASLHFGWVSEMKTGEGKTLVATLPLYLNALAGYGCHLVTVNDYTRLQNFRGASLVVSDLGEPTQPFAVLEGTASGGGWVDAKLLSALKG